MGVLGSNQLAAETKVPNEFTSGTPAKASEVIVVWTTERLLVHMNKLLADMEQTANPTPLFFRIHVRKYSSRQSHEAWR